MRARTLLVAAVALASCSSEPGGFGPPPDRSVSPAPSPTENSIPPGGPRRTVTVETPGYRYEPTVVVLGPGEAVTIELRNPDTRPHALTVNELSVRMEAGPGETVRLPLDAPETGSFVMYCSLPGHRQAGHRGRLDIR